LLSSISQTVITEKWDLLNKEKYSVFPSPYSILTLLSNEIKVSKKNDDQEDTNNKNEKIKQNIKNLNNEDNSNILNKNIEVTCSISINNENNNLFGQEANDKQNNNDVIKNEGNNNFVNTKGRVKKPRIITVKC